MNSKINKQMGNLTREEIEQYFHTTDLKVKQAIEKKAKQNVFDQEALAGYKSTGATIKDLKHLDKKFKPKSPLKYYILGTTLACAVIGGIILFQSNTTTIEKPSDIQLANQMEQALPDSISTLEIQDASKVIAFKNLVKPKLKVKQEKNTQPELTKTELIPISSLPILQPEFPEKKVVISKKVAKEIYLNDLKLIDYRNYRSAIEIKVNAIQLSGTPADLENKESNSEQAIQQNISVPYHDFIKKTTELFKLNDFKQVVARCNTILSKYPDDLNALFYSGVAYHNLGEYDKAISLFISCINASYSNFIEEAEWMLANSYLQKGDHLKAQAIFDLIKENGGYYSSSIPKK